MVMSYDADSFKAGFALGRLLWRPPARVTADTGLGWSAYPEYLTLTAGDYLGRVGISSYYSYHQYPYYKTGDGVAVGVFVYNRMNGEVNYCGPILLSTASANVRFERRHSGYSDVTYFTANGETLQYAGLTWYVNANGAWGNPSNYTKGLLPLFDAAGYTALEDICRAILRRARVHRTGGGA